MLAVAALLINLPSKPRKVSKASDLTTYFDKIEGYEKLRCIKLDENASEMLDLDDYLFCDYQNSEALINLFIGYYYTADKAYASHSPLVCYPSQGWKIDQQPTKHDLKINGYSIHLEEITTSYGKKKELVMYWYQTHQYTNTEIFKNKIDMAVSKFKHNDEQHAFIRISTPLGEASYQNAKKRTVAFIKAFYPKFISFINED